MAESAPISDKLSKSLDEIIAENKKDRVDKRKNFRNNRRGGNNIERKIDDPSEGDRNNNNNSRRGGDRPWKKNGGRGGNDNRNSGGFGGRNRGGNGFGRTNNSFDGGNNNRRDGGNNQNRRRNRVFVDNLHHDIVNSDIRELFEQIGTLKRCGINWDSLGRSTGSAVVEFEQFEDARKAVSEYNGAVLDGQVLEVRLADQHDGPKIQKRIRKESFGSGRKVVSKARD